MSSSLTAVEKAQTATQFSDAAPELAIPFEVDNAIRFAILMHVATQKPDIPNGRRLGRIFDALIGDWDWDDLMKPREGPGHTADNPVWLVGLKDDQREGELEVALTKVVAQDLWDEIGRKCEEKAPKEGADDLRWNTIQIMAATKLHDALGFMLGRKPEDGKKK